MENKNLQLSIFDPHTDVDDLPLFECLSLTPFFLPKNQEHLVGVVQLDNGTTAEIRVIGTPILRWEIAVTTRNGNSRSHISASGLLSDIWSQVENLVQ